MLASARWRGSTVVALKEALKGQVEYIAMEAPLLAPAVFGHMTAERFRPAHVQVLRQPGVAGLGGLFEVGRQGHFPGCGLAIRP